jgi:hypothetical protein
MTRPSSYRDMAYGNAQQYAGPGQDALARSSASASEDEMLRGLLGSSRELGENERMPRGSYAGAKYPELSRAVEWGKTGNMPLTGGGSMAMWLKEQQDPQLRDKNSQQRRNWADQQARLLGGRY